MWFTQNLNRGVILRTRCIALLILLCAEVNPQPGSISVAIMMDAFEFKRHHLIWARVRCSVLNNSSVLAVVHR